MSIIDQVSEHLHSWKSTQELRSRLLQNIEKLLATTGICDDDESTTTATARKKLHDLFSSITSSVIQQPALGHDEDVLLAMLKVLDFCISSSSSSSTKMMIHSRHISSIITALQNHRKMITSSNNNNTENEFSTSVQVRSTFLSLLHKVTKLATTSSNNDNNSIVLLPSDSISSLMSSLLDLDDYFKFVLQNREENENTSTINHQHYYFSLLQHYVSSTDQGTQSFIKFGGAAIFSQKKLLKMVTDNKSTSLLLVQKAVSVIHAATASSLDVCSEVSKFGLLNDIIELLDKTSMTKTSKISTSEEDSSSTVIPLHCLGIIQNVLREINCSKQFWRCESNINVLVKSALDPRVVDESVRSQSMVILLANAANCEREKKKEEQSNNNTMTIKKDLKRCLTAAHTLTLVEEVVNSKTEERV